MKCIRILWWTLRLQSLFVNQRIGRCWGTRKARDAREQTQMQVLTVHPIDVACHHQLLRPLIATATVVAPSIVYHCRVLVAFYGPHRPAVTDAHREYPLVPHSALSLGSQSAHQYIEDNLNEQVVNVTLVVTKIHVLFFMCGPLQKKHPRPSVPVPLVLAGAVPPKSPLPAVVS